MRSKTFATICGVIFGVIAAVHVARLVMGWDAVIGGVAIPLWASAVAAIVSAYLAYEGLRLGRKP